MIRVRDLLTAERVDCDLRAGSKKRVLELMSGLLAAGEPRLTQTEVFDSLLSRERLGSTGLGHGVAIPHGRLKHSTRAIGAFVKLANGIDFDAVDCQPVDLLFALLVPEQSTQEHLELLAQLAQMFSDADLVRRLRQTNERQALLDLIDQCSPGR